MNKPALKNLKDKPYGGAQYVDDPNLKQWVKDTAIMIAEEEPWFDEDIHIKFLNRYREWLLSSKENYFVNLEWFEHSAFSLGTSEAFDKFYMKHSNRRFRCLPGEYMYHQASFRNFFPDWRFIDEDNPIKRTDALVVSMPFSDGTEPFMKEIFNECSHLQVPILLDCAYMGICRNYVFELNYPTIEAVTFSLSKFLPVPHFRIGMRLTKEDDDDSLMVHHKTRYVNRFGCAMGLEILNNFHPDDIVNGYQPAQEALCKELGVEPSKCVIFGVDTQNKYPEYNRGGTTNRLCLSRHLYSKRLDLHKDIK